jgi:hypothetical protein
MRKRHGVKLTVERLFRDRRDAALTAGSARATTFAAPALRMVAPRSKVRLHDAARSAPAAIAPLLRPPIGSRDPARQPDVAALGPVLRTHPATSFSISPTSRLGTLTAP